MFSSYWNTLSRLNMRVLPCITVFYFVIFGCTHFKREMEGGGFEREREVEKAAGKSGRRGNCLQVVFMREESIFKTTSRHYFYSSKISKFYVLHLNWCSALSQSTFV